MELTTGSRSRKSMPSATVHKLKQEQGSGLAIVRACLDAVGAAEFGAAASLHAHRTEPLTSLCSNWHRLRLAPTRLQQSGGGGKHVSGSLATASAASALAQNGTMQGIKSEIHTFAIFVFSHLHLGPAGAVSPPWPRGTAPTAPPLYPARSLSPCMESLSAASSSCFE